MLLWPWVSAIIALGYSPVAHVKVCWLLQSWPGLSPPVRGHCVGFLGKTCVRGDNELS